MADRVGQQFGNYQLIRLLGEGGFAEVYLGEHIHLGTQAAIKVLHTQLTTDDLDKFRIEARTVARLIHPNIVRVLEFGVEGKTPFLVMDYATNGTLRQRHPKSIPLPLATVVSYVKQVADALQFAHDEKLIHRDIKPENMLLGRRNEILLSDFGIALVAQSSRYQSTQDMAGTMAYMAPEQIQGKPRPASDQYSLGIVVYEWLSGERPFHGSLTEIVGQHLAVPPPPLREKVPEVSSAVEQVVMIALAKDPHQRFASMQAFAHALEQAGQADAVTFVKPPAPTVQPLPATVIIPPKPENKPPVLVTPPLEPTLPVVISDPVGTILYTYRGHYDVVNALAWSPSSTHIASGGSDSTVQLWNTSTGEKVLTYKGHSNNVNSVAWSPDGTRIASGSWDGTVQIWNADTGSRLFTYRYHTNWVYSVAWSPDGTYIASGGKDKTVLICNTVTGQIITCQGHLDYIYEVAWSPEGSRIASVSEDQTVRVWNARTGNLLFTYRDHASGVNAVAWSPDGTYLASGSWDNTVQIWSVTNGDKLFTYLGHSAQVYDLAWSLDGKLIASAGEDKTVQVWSTTTGEQVFAYRGHSKYVTAVAWSPVGKRIASASHDRTVQVWVAP